MVDHPRTTSCRIAVMVASGRILSYTSLPPSSTYTPVLLQRTERLTRRLILELEGDQECQDDSQVDIDRSAVRYHHSWLQHG